MADIAQRGNRLTFAKGGTVRRPKKPSTHGKDVPTMAAEGGRIGLKHGTKPWGTGPKPGSHEYWMQDIHKKRKGKATGGRAGFSMAGHVLKGAKKAFKRITHEVPTGPHTDVRRRELNKKVGHKKQSTNTKKDSMSSLDHKKYELHKRGADVSFKSGGKADKKWIQKAVNPKHKGFCTPMTKKTCTPRRKALARTFKKMGRERKAKG